MLHTLREVTIVFWSGTCIDGNAATSKIASQHTLGTAFFLVDYPLMIGCSIYDCAICQCYPPELLFAVALEECCPVNATLTQYFVFTLKCANCHQPLLGMYKRICTEAVIVCHLMPWACTCKQPFPRHK